MEGKSSYTGPTPDEELFRPGDTIGGKYEVHRRLGKGGFGVVYLIYDQKMKGVYALKTFRDELLADAAARQAFKKEALLWVNLEEHPFILPARWVEEFSGRLFVQMDYIAPDKRGRVSLADHLATAGGPLETEQVLKWALQFCYGMVHAGARGIRAHRDIKPANILITQDLRVQIADFGLAAAASGAGRSVSGSLVGGGGKDGYSLSLLQSQDKQVCGTPGYISPEVFEGKCADIRSDIYAFGLVLWQMAAGSPVPLFHPTGPYSGAWEYQTGVYRLQKSGRVPPVEGPLGEVIERCLRFEPAHRYPDFAALRESLEPHYRRLTGGVVDVPPASEKSVAFWTNKGAGLQTLGRYDEAMQCYDCALDIDARHVSAWANKGNMLHDLGRYDEALRCCERALTLDPQGAYAWNNKGIILHDLERHEEALYCYDRALAVDPRFAYAWNNRGNSLQALGRYEDALSCYDRALAADPRFSYAWNNKGKSLRALGRSEEAILSYDRALAVDPQNALTWYNKGNSLCELERHEEALDCFDRTLAIDPRHALAWNNKGNSLQLLGRYEEAVYCYEQTLAIDPQYIGAWLNKALTEEELGRLIEAVKSYRKFIETAPPQYAQHIEHARQRLRELK